MSLGTQNIQLTPGDVIEDRYLLEEKLGEGGFGSVFRATQLNIGRKVAIKVVLPHLLATGNGLERFLREAQVAQRLEHPNIVRMYDFGHTSDGTPYIAWELLKGQPLDEALDAGKPLAVNRVVRISTQVLKALMDAHSQGIVHRDIKPANIFLSEFSGEPDFVKVLDFGIAKALDVTGEPTKALTMAGQIIGTPNYMAPEQVEGKEVGPSADLYSLGLVMSEMLTGQSVFVGTGLAVCAAQLSPAPVPIPPEVLRSSLGSIIGRATQKNLGDRYEKASELFDDLQRFGNGQVSERLRDDTSGNVWGGAISSSPGISPEPLSQSAPTQPASKSTPSLILLAFGVVVFTMVFGIGALSIALFTTNRESSTDPPTWQTGQSGTMGQTGSVSFPTSSSQSEVPPPSWGITSLGGPVPASINQDITLVTPALVVERLQAAGYNLVQQPIVNDDPSLLMSHISGMRGQNVAAVMLYYFYQNTSLPGMVESLRRTPCAIAHNDRMVVYVRIVGPDGGQYAAQEMLAYIMR